ncbi:MAG TPA: GTPase, partial [Streptosporangiaceae bacterium]
MSASLPSAVELGSDGAGDGLPAGSGLSDRFTAVARLIQIGSARTGGDGFDPGLLQDAEGLLARAGERLRLSAEHTIVVLAGGTGSGKSSLFNRLAGAEFSAAGAIRPVTRQPHACVWGMTGAGSLLDWLGVQPRYRYARSSALDEGERSLAGLLLLDLPDHDSVLAGRASEVDRLLKLADLMVWVLDPQKYA